MLGTDSVEHLGLWPTMKISQRICAKHITRVFLHYVVGELFHLKCCFWLAPFPHKLHTLSENCNLGRLFPRSLCGFHNEIAKEFLISNGIEPVIHKECRDRLGGLHRDI